jgi:hypothetical protein
MQKTDKNKNKNIFDNIIREKLADYSLPLDIEVWNEIKARLDVRPKKTVLRFWISSAAAAVVVILGGLIFMYNDKTKEYETAEQLSGYEEKVTAKIPMEEIMPTVSPSYYSSQHIARVRKTTEEPVEKETIPESDVIEISEDLPLADLPPAENPVSRKDMIHKFPPDQCDTFVSVILSKKKASMAFYIGSGGALLAMNNEQPMVSKRSDAILENGSIGFAPPPSFAAPPEPEEENFSDITHYAPISFGLTVKKELNDRFALESGLVYAYLASKFENKNPEKDALLQLHYLGIPLNLHTKIIGNPHKWGVYLSAGAMVEKGLFSHYSLNEYFSNSIQSGSTDRKIDGWQWSLNIALGGEYKLIRNYSIYLEPKVNYYLKNNQPLSARTENPLIIGINAGVRYSW